MPIEDVVQLLLEEKRKIDAALAILGQTTKRRGRQPKDPLANAPSWVTGKPGPEKPARKKRKFSAKQRAEQAARMKAYWKAKKTGKKKNK